MVVTSEVSFCSAQLCSFSSAVDSSVSNSGNCGAIAGGAAVFAACFFFPMVTVLKIDGRQVVAVDSWQKTGNRGQLTVDNRPK